MRRLLALAGGGVRGIAEVAFLEAVERVYRARRGPEARLARPIYEHAREVCARRYDLDKLLP